MKILTIGGAARDIFIQYDNQQVLCLNTESGKRCYLALEEGAKIDAYQLSYFTGGGATNSAVSFKRLGFDVHTFFKIGNDLEGTFILEQLAQSGINIDAVKISHNQPTANSFIIPCPSGDRVVLIHRGANLTVSEKDFPLEMIKNFDHLYITSLGGKSAQLLLPIVQEAKKHNISVAANPGASQLAAGAEYLQNALRNIDILTLNCSEAIKCMMSLGQTKSSTTLEQNSKKDLPKLLQHPIAYENVCFTLPEFFNAMFAQGPQVVAVTNGAEGVYVGVPGKIYFYPSIKNTIASTLGAGDSFGSCFIAQLAQQQSVEDALIAGVVNASSVIAHMDAKTGLLTQQQLKNELEKVNKNLLLEFSSQ